jgi:uncharacterized membrane protein
MFAMAVVFISVALGIFVGGWTFPHGPADAPPLFFLFFGVLWLGFAVFWAVKLLLVIVYGIKAGRGEWAEYPILGRFARHILRIGPGGAVINP